MKEALKLRAEDAEDMAFVAACLQDALVPVGDVAYLPGEKRFVLVANRFRWEASGDREPGGLYERVNCGVTFDGVSKVRSKGVDLSKRDQMLDLLTVKLEKGAVLLVFAGGGVIRLDIESLRCDLRDLGQPWPTRWRPHHSAGDED